MIAVIDFQNEVELHKKYLDEYEKLTEIIESNPVPKINCTEFFEEFLSGIGYTLKCSFVDLVRVFGLPMNIYISPGSKIRAEWRMISLGYKFTIYDYKDHMVYNPSKRKNLFDIEYWSVGCCKPDAGLGEMLKCFFDGEGIEIEIGK